MSFTFCPYCQATASPTKQKVVLRPASLLPPVMEAADNCPICDRILSAETAGGSLYGVEVCTGCRTEFATHRIFAQVLDAFAWILFTLFLAGLLRSFGTWGIVAALCVLISFPGYLLKDYLNEGSVGKRLLGLRVIDSASGAPVSPMASLIRNLPLVIPGMPLALAFTMMDGYRFCDSAAGSKVIIASKADRKPFRVGNATENAPEIGYSPRLGRV